MKKKFPYRGMAAESHRIVNGFDDFYKEEVAGAQPTIFSYSV